MVFIINLKSRHVYLLIFVVFIAIALLINANFHLYQVSKNLVDKDILDLLSYKAHTFILAYNQNLDEYIKEEGKYLGVVENYQQFSKEDIFEYLSLNIEQSNLVALDTIRGWYVNDNINHARISFAFSNKDLTVINVFEAEFKKINNKWELIFVGYHQ